MIMPMLLNLTNIISLYTQDWLIKFKKQSSMKSINTTHVLNQINYSNPFLFLTYLTLSFLFVASFIDINPRIEQIIKTIIM